MSFEKVLVANRGEIAVRVIRSARSLGYRTVAVYSEADAGAPHVALADEAVCVGPPLAAESYLKVEALLAAAKKTGADAIHPGYGFLSENAGFARACAEAGITFVGPPPDAIELMGSKRLAKNAMIEAGVPCVPGYEADDTSDEALLKAAEEVGFPLMVKASAGGGGRGMRLVTSKDELPDALASARKEAENAFGSGELILERAVMQPRHVEIQVFADTKGNCIHLGERDCSVQRRHQKVVEECPSPAVDGALRQQMGEAAVAAAKACGYVGAGTVEFLLDQEGSFYFLEMNTRLQVEHPVTELVTGQDLVAWQLRVAAGQPLPLSQDELPWRGHAIEVRLYAEDPRRGYLPQTGRVIRWSPPEGDGVRVDAGVADAISPFYDPMVAKVIAYGADRDEARRRLRGALERTRLFGVRSNQAFLRAILDHETFAKGEATTAFLGEAFADHATLQLGKPTDEAWAEAAAIVMAERARRQGVADELRLWRSGGPIWNTVALEADDEACQVLLMGSRDGGISARVQHDADAMPADAIDLSVEVDGARARVERDGVARHVDYALAEDTLWLDDGTGATCFVDVTQRPAQSADGAGSGRLTAPLDGAVIALRTEEGATVAKGDVLLVLEAMKMEHRIAADVDGTVKAVHVAVGDQAKTRQLLVEVEPSDAEEGGA